MKKYFVYELKKSLFVLFALAIIATAVYVISVISEINKIRVFEFHRLNLGSIISCGGAMSVIIPIWKLRYKMKKSSVDLYYSMPLSHTQILAVKFTVGLVVLFSAFSIAYWIGSFTAMAAMSKYLKCVNFIPLYFSLFIPMTVIYALTAFIFTRANRFIDGIMFVIMTGMSLGMVAGIIPFFARMFGTYIHGYNYHSYYFTPFGILGCISFYFSGNIIESISMSIKLSACDWSAFSLVTALGVASGIGLFFAERRVKAENCEQISESFFGYKVMIPLYTFSLAFVCARSSLVLAVLVAAAAYAVSVLYKRTPKIGWRFALIVGVSFLAGVGLSFIY